MKFKKDTLRVVWFFLSKHRVFFMFLIGLAILAGIIVPKNLGMLKYMNSSVAGVSVPESLMKRMEGAKLSAGDDKKQARKNQAEEGIKITVELINQVKEIPGVRGVHIQAIEWEQKVPEILEKAGLIPRPVLQKEGG